MRAISQWFDVVILILVMAIGSSFTVTLFQVLQRDAIVRTEDKTMMDVDNAIYLSDGPETGADILMTLLMVDDYIPYPRAIKINDNPIIKLDKAFISNKHVLINQIYNGSEQNLKSMITWKVTSSEFDYKRDTPCIHYILVP